MNTIAQLIGMRKGQRDACPMKPALRSMTSADKDACARLRQIWDRKRKALGMTQDAVAEKFGRTQGLIAQYLNGHTALGPVAVLKFARILEVSPTDIRPDFSYGVMIPGEIPPDVVEIAIKLSSLPAEVRRDAIGFLNVTLANKGYIDLITRLSANGRTVHADP